MRKIKLTIPEGIRCFQRNFETHQLVIEEDSSYLTGREIFSHEVRFLGIELIWNNRIVKYSKINNIFCQISTPWAPPKKVAKWRKGKQIIFQSAT